ncbi:MAG: transglycosylase [Deltaproteobacteria bacterium HGW-Deltaproteobacteria-15]|jgi:membrane-bound lytic murein transglycosylase F|nr:MAG: transglycosylase [Deltaproteobacteria bacterium HGW-Deltaproteobacteria-15]
MRWKEKTWRVSRKVGIFLALVFFVSLPSRAHPSETYKNNSEYDRYFLKYSIRYFGSHFDWRYFKAQAIAESNLRPTVQSQDGAMGIMQILPGTFREITDKNPFIWSDPQQPRWNIAAGIYYNWVMWNEWQESMTVQDRLNFMFASYNAGKYTILKAQQLAAQMGLNPNSWDSISKVLLLVSGSAKETVAYVKKINRIWTTLQ